ncbi:replication protein C, IncQ-type, partial [Aeromonas caviae]
GIPFTSGISAQSGITTLSGKKCLDLWGQIQRPHARIDMNEVRSLKSDPARLIHQRLCGWIDPGKSGRASLDTLCNYIWPDPAIADAMRKRQQIARRAVGELFTIGWLVTEYRKDMWEIRRPRNRSLE